MKGFVNLQLKRIEICKGIQRLIVILCLVVASGPAYARSLEEIIESGYVSIFVYEDFPPFSFKDHEDLKGIDVEIGIRIAQDLGVEARFVTKPKSLRFIDDLTNALGTGGDGAVDLMMHVPQSSMQGFASHTNDTNSSILPMMLVYYFRERLSLLVDVKSAGDRDLAGFLRSEHIGVVAGTMAEFYLAKLKKAFGADETSIVRYRNIAGAIEGFRSEEVKGYYGIRSQAELTARSAGRQTGITFPSIAGQLNSEWNVGIGVRKSAPELRNKLENLMAKFKSQGTLASIFAQSGITYPPVESK